MKIAFLVYNAYGIGGTIRATANTSAAFADRGHQVEVVSVYRARDDALLPFSPAVRLRPLVDWREGSETCERSLPEARQPSTMWTDTGVSGSPMRPSRLTDRRIAAYLRGTDADVVISTRPVLHGHLARDGRRDAYLRIGQEHLLLGRHAAHVRVHQNRALAKLDAYVTVSEADAAEYRAAVPRAADRILAIPNSVPAPEVAPSDGESKVIVAAGRLVGLKRFDLLIDAFAALAPRHPDWSLRIYGRGVQAQELRARIEALGMHERIRMMGPVSPLDPEWAKGAIAAVASRRESFGMTIVEALHCGVPVVSTDCPHGPGEILTHDHDGLLVPMDSGAEGLTAALESLITDPARRARLASHARDTAARYAPDRIASRYLELFASLAGRRRRTGLLHRVTSLLPRHAAPVPAPAEGAAPVEVTEAAAAPWTARASARVETDGGVLFRLRDPEDAPGPLLGLVLKLRRDPARRTVVLPLEGDGTARLPADGPGLAEGRWDLHLDQGPDRPRPRVAAGTVETAALIGRSPRVAPDGTTVARIPYRTSEGNLTLRVWNRPRHAEVTSVEMAGRLLRVRVALHGARLGEGAAGELRLRSGGTVAPVPVTVTGGPGTGGVSLELDVDTLPALGGDGAQDVWDWYLLPAAGVPAVRLARLADDLVERKAVDRLPATTRPADGRNGDRLRPYFTVDNDLALSVKPLPAPGRPAAG
ncbi:glycosyltransferase [Streptomyces sp. NPDC005012]|uniref:glycosyltransferase n=1 Tax=Streptomyces sp. NPDC005012 TaxID=3154558 RepID=UPI00339DF89F